MRQMIKRFNELDEIPPHSVFLHTETKTLLKILDSYKVNGEVVVKEYQLTKVYHFYLVDTD